MITAIMQPYIFPYIGYFQLINESDIFIFYDDVNYIKNGWIDRNRILSNRRPIYFKVPTLSPSPNKKICDLELNKAEYGRWQSKFFKTLHHAYSKAAFYRHTLELLSSIITKKFYTVSELAIFSVIEISKHLQISSDFKKSSDLNIACGVSGENRILEICVNQKTTQFINMEGGRHLYSNEKFHSNNIKLHFHKPSLNPYKQYTNPFFPALSIIDVMMHNSADQIKNNLIR